MVEFYMDLIDLLDSTQDNLDINNTTVGKEEDFNNNITPLIATSFMNKEFSSDSIKLDDTLNQINSS